MATILNLTPHAITIPDCTPPHAGPPADWTLPPSGMVARAESKSTPADPIDGIPTSHVEYGVLVDMPEPRDGVYLVVSSVCVMAARAQGRPVDDLLVPGDQIRDSAGRVIGCRSLARQLPGSTTESIAMTMGIIRPSGAVTAITLSHELSATLVLDNERQMYDLAFMDERLTHEQRMAFDAHVKAIDADADQCRRMRQVCALQDALPSGGVLCYSDGSLARLATCDLLPGGR